MVQPPEGVTIESIDIDEKEATIQGMKMFLKIRIMSVLRSMSVKLLKTRPLHYLLSSQMELQKLPRKR